MSPKRNPKSKRVHDSDSGQFIPEDKINSLTPSGYSDEDDGSSIGFWLLVGAVVLVVAYAYSNGLILA